MKMLLLTILTTLLFTSCEKDDIQAPPAPAHPQMNYMYFGDAEAGYRQPLAVDVDDDGTVDFTFSVLHVGDAAMQRDRLQFLAKSKIDRKLLNDADDRSPMLKKSEIIGAQSLHGQWWELSSVLLTEKITTYDDRTWHGEWKKANHNYLPIQLKKDGKLFHGWIELSFDAVREKIIIHKAAVSREEERNIRAGF